MTISVETINFVLALMTLALQIGLALVIVSVLTKSFLQGVGLLSKYVIPLCFLLALGAFGMSLFYSQIIGYEPCTFCWWQRIFIYPQVVILGLAWIKKDNKVLDYCLALSIIGALIGAYQYYGQMFNLNALPCSAVGVSCSIRQFVEFGYITMPLMSVTVFVAIIVLIWVKKKTRRHE